MGVSFLGQKYKDSSSKRSPPSLVNVFYIYTVININKVRNAGCMSACWEHENCALEFLEPFLLLIKPIPCDFSYLENNLSNARSYCC